MSSSIWATFFASILALLAMLLVWASPPAFAQTQWRGLAVAPEDRCTPYDSDDYRYSQSLEDDLYEEYGSVYSPYTGETFVSDRETDIEHMVARSEAHDSGLCAVSAGIKRTFSNDLLNLTFADPNTNRRLKSDKDAAEWMPEMNQCWFAGRVVAVKQKYRLSVDAAERDALESVLSRCASTEMVMGTSGGNPAREVVNDVRDAFSARVNRLADEARKDEEELRNMVRDIQSQINVDVKSDDAAMEDCPEIKPETDLGIEPEIDIAITIRSLGETACAVIRL